MKPGSSLLSANNILRSGGGKHKSSAVPVQAARIVTRDTLSYIYIPVGSSGLDRVNESGVLRITEDVNQRVLE